MTPKCYECGSKNVTITGDSWSNNSRTTVFCEVMNCNDCGHREDINSFEDVNE